MTSNEMINIESPANKRIALVAHDNMKREMLEWATEHKDELNRHTLIATGSTGKLIADSTGLKIERMRSGPLGGDQQIGARISEAGIDILLFFWACNRASADFILSSPLIGATYQRRVPKY
jgi:methylglyoxal synthase